MAITKPIPFNKLIDAFLDESVPFHPRYLNRLSDLEPQDQETLAKAWPQISARRRENLLEDLEEFQTADNLLNYEAVARIGLNDPAPLIRQRAIRILREYELVDLLPRFVDMAQHDSDTAVRAEAASALASFIYLGEVEELSQSRLKKVEDCLLSLVKTAEDKLVQRRALEALGFSSLPELTGLIEKAYASKDIDWLVSALFAMGRSADSQWKPQVLAMLTHADPTVRAEAATAAGELEIKAARKALLDLLTDSDIDVRMAATWALSQIGGSGVRKAIEALLDSAVDDEEEEHIQASLENYDFTEEMKDFTLLDVGDNGNGHEPSPDEDEEDVDDDLLAEDDEA